MYTMESISTNSKRKNQENIIRTRKYTINSLAFITTYIDKCITHLNYLEEKGRVTSDEKWVVRQIDEISELKYIFIKWADDVRKNNR